MIGDEQNGEDYWLDPGLEMLANLHAENFDKIRTSRVSEKSAALFQLPGVCLELVGYGDRLTETLCGALAHRKIDRIPENSEIIRWEIADSQGQSGLAVLPAPSKPELSIGGLFHNSDRDVLVERRGSYVSVFDIKAKLIQTIAPGIDGLDTDLVAKPLLRLLAGVWHRAGYILCHAAFAGLNGKGVLVPGAGGAGKSTIATASLLAGADFCGDDFVLLRQEEDGLVGHSLFSSLMLADAHIANFPQLGRYAKKYSLSAAQKHMIFVDQVFPGQTKLSLKVDAMAVPKIVQEKQSKFIAGRHSQIWRALAPTSVFSSPWQEVSRAHFLLDVVQDLEPLTYCSGSDFALIANPLMLRYANQNDR